jgi:hypothetical protein
MRQAAVFALFANLWGFLTSLWDFEGSSPDPLGRPRPTTDAGSSPDPLG